MYELWKVNQPSAMSANASIFLPIFHLVNSIVLFPAAYQCHGRWESDGVTYVVASPNSRPSGAPRRVCFAYSARGVGEEGIDGDNRAPPTVTLTARHDTCSPTTQNAHLTLNATLTGMIVMYMINLYSNIRYNK